VGEAGSAITISCLNKGCYEHKSGRSLRVGPFGLESCSIDPYLPRLVGIPRSRASNSGRSQPVSLGLNGAQ
jgi:hypothetical protein